MVDGDKVAEPLGQPFRFDGDVVRRSSRARRDDHVHVTLAFFFGQERDERCVKRSRAGARQQLLWRAGGEDVARVHRDEPIEPRGLVHIGGGDHDAHAGPIDADPIDQFPKLTPRQRINARRRFVQDQEVRVMDQGAA
jgi:hypothetical protein